MTSAFWKIINMFRYNIENEKNWCVKSENIILHMWLGEYIIYPNPPDFFLCSTLLAYVELWVCVCVRISGQFMSKEMDSGILINYIIYLLWHAINLYYVMFMIWFHDTFHILWY